MKKLKEIYEWYGQYACTTYTMYSVDLPKDTRVFFIVEDSGDKLNLFSGADPRELFRNLEADKCIASFTEKEYRDEADKENNEKTYQACKAFMLASQEVL